MAKILERIEKASETIDAHWAVFGPRPQDRSIKNYCSKTVYPIENRIPKAHLQSVSGRLEATAWKSAEYFDLTGKKSG